MTYSFGGPSRPLHPRNMSVADESRRQSSFISLPRARDFEIEHADSIPRLTFVGPSIARTYHDPLVGSLLAPEINHGVRNRRIAFDSVSPRPESQIARSEFLQFKGIVVSTVDGAERPGLSQ